MSWIIGTTKANFLTFIVSICLSLDLLYAIKPKYFISFSILTVNKIVVQKFIIKNTISMVNKILFSTNTSPYETNKEI